MENSCLFTRNTPWVPDSLRDPGHRRAELFAVFKNELEKRQLPFVLIEGTWEERFAIAKQNVEEILRGS
ncbi:hypothetical protein [Runella slithyformis]|uniref:hypothetical protein n=1 Tax=Runella slithyformis TaxID=106 RepID=UPI0002F91A0F|nr:hypothetical protein [Runella slithyformis]